MNALKNFRNLTRLRGHFRGQSRQRGSTLLLVVAVLLMILLVSMAYLQIARADRLNGGAMRVNEAVDTVTNASIGAVAFRLHEDRIDSGGALLPDEGYDYPGNKDKHLANTVPTINGSVLDWDQISLIGLRYADNTTAQNTLDAQDASVLYDGQGRPANDIDSSNGKWSDTDGDGIIDSFAEESPIPQLAGLKWYTSYRVVDLSSLLDVNVATAMTAATVGAPSDPAAGADNNYGTQRPRGYNPAHIDMTRLFRRGPTGDTSPVWTQELGGHITGPNAGPGLLAFRLGLTTGTNAIMPLVSAPSDLDDPSIFAPGAQSVAELWWGTDPNPPTTPQKASGARRYGSSVLKLGIENEIELRLHNGINDASINAQVENQLPQTLQRNTSQLKYTDVATGASPIAHYLLGITTGQTAPYVVDQRRFPSLRPLLTTRAGADDFLPDYFTTAGVNQYDQLAGNAGFRYDLVYQDGGASAATPTQRIEEIAKRLIEIFQVGATPAEQYLGDYGGTDTTRAVTAYMMAAAVQDYSDNDTILPPPNDKHAPTLIEARDATGNPLPTPLYVSGIERMPFLREVYMQARYNGEDTDNADGDNDPTTGNYEIWNIVPGSEAMLIEMGNPFTQEIDLADVPFRLVVNGATLLPGVTAGTVVDARDDTTEADLMLLVLEPTNPAVIGDPLNGGETGGMTEYGADVLTDLGIVTGMTALIDPIVVIPPMAMGTWFATNTDITVEVQIQTRDPAGTRVWVTYDRMVVGGFQLPDTQTPVIPSTKRVVHAQRTMGRDGQMIRYIGPLAVGGTAAEIDYRAPDEMGYRTRLEDPMQQVDALAADTKGTLAGRMELDNVRLGIPDRAYFTSTELAWTPILGITTAGPIGPDPVDPTSSMAPSMSTLTIPEVIEARIGSSGDKGFFLDFDHTTPKAAGIALPSHAAMVIDRFTTISPLFDGVDNDGDGATSPDEIALDKTPETFIPGRLNINTVPLHIATLAAPIPDTLGNNEAWFRAIFAYRDAPTADDSTTPFDESTVRDPAPPYFHRPRTQKGIEGLAELMDFEVKPLATGGFAYDTGYYALNGSDDSALPINLFPMPEDNPAWADTGAATGFVQEERVARMQFIQNTFTTRSDLYAAYILVRGYNPGDLKNPVAQRRVVVIFDRSSVFQPGDPVKILGMYQE